MAATNSSDPINPKLFIQAGIGSGAIILNLLVLLILSTDLKLLKKSAFLFGLAIGNIVLALAFLVANTYRIAMTIYGVATLQTTVSYCLTTMVPEFYYLAFCTPAQVMLAVGVERLVAVVLPGWYYTKWTLEKNWYVLGIAAIFASVPVVAACVWGVLHVQSDRVTYQCLWNFVSGNGFARCFYMISILGGSCAVIATLVAFAAGRYRLARLPKAYSQNEIRRRAQKQLQLTKAMLSVACLDFCLVVIPNLLLLLSVGFGVRLQFNSSEYSLYAYNANAVLNIMAHVVFNVEFRRSAIKFFRCDRFGWAQNFGTVTVAPAGVSVQKVN